MKTWKHWLQLMSHLLPLRQLWMCSGTHDAVRWVGLQVGGDLRLKKGKSPKVEVARNCTSTNCHLTEKWGSYLHSCVFIVWLNPACSEALSTAALGRQHPAHPVFLSCLSQWPAFDEHCTEPLNMLRKQLSFFSTLFLCWAFLLKWLSWRRPNNLRRERSGRWQRVEPGLVLTTRSSAADQV